jgi:3-oxoacyl-[acyl-carrier protein] reductase
MPGKSRIGGCEPSRAALALYRRSKKSNILNAIGDEYVFITTPVTAFPSSRHRLRLPQLRFPETDTVGNSQRRDVSVLDTSYRSQKGADGAADKSARLAGKIALVTGGGRGIGAAIAIELASQGATVTIGYRSSRDAAVKLADELVDKGLKAEAHPLDTGSPDDIRATITGIADRWNRLDILVNNAGLPHNGRIEDVVEATIDEMLAVNVKGVFVAIQEALLHMPSGSRIVNIGSISSDYMPYGGHSLYVMSKAAVAGLTRGLARELAERNITINNVQPGRVETDLLRFSLGSEIDRARSQTPFGRFGDVSDVAHMVAFLCGEEAGYVTGANLRVDGGNSV